MLNQNILSLREINDDLAAIEAKYDNCDAVSKGLSKGAKMKKEIMEALKKLSSEFDTLGIPKIDILKTNDETEILEQLMQNSYMLIQMYRRKLKQISSMRLSIANQDTLRLRMNDDFDKYECDISRKDNEISKLKQELNNLKSEFEENNKTCETVRSRLKRMKAAYSAKQNELDHTVQQLKNEIECLKIKYGENLGKYKSSDAVLAERLKRYRENEETYRETIIKLQENNRVLMEEVLNLKQEIVYFLINHNKRDRSESNTTDV